jgi:hypothetical protein
MEHNWVQTIPGKGWFMILRLGGPLEPWFNKTWRPGEIELQPLSSELLIRPLYCGSGGETG